MLSVTVANSSGNGYAGLNFNSSGGYTPPDTNGAAGPNGYVEVVNQAVALFPNKASNAGMLTDNLSHFLFTTGGLSRTNGTSGLSDPTIVFDEKINRYIIGDQDVDFTNHVSSFDLAVSKSNNPATLTAADWSFYKITTTEANEDADYPGNMGYNADALVFTLNMFPVSGTTATYHTQVVSVNTTDLANTVAQGSLHVYRNDLADFSVRPTTMHDAVAGDPMWLVTEHGDYQSIDVYKMSNVLSNTAKFTVTNLGVQAYNFPDNPLNPSGTQITNNEDSRILKAAEANNTIVACHTVASSATQNVAQWYAINVSSGTPVLSQQGRVGAGNNTYVDYSAIDINSSGTIGMSFLRAGNDTATDYMSMYVTGRASSDTAGTMQTPVLVSAGTGQANYKDFTSGGRAGDLSGINVDPVDGSFWAANEFANTLATANWGTAIANFSIGQAAAVSADLAVSASGPSTVTAGTNATYSVTIKNNGPNAASGVVLSDTIPAGSVFVSMTQTTGSDAFTFSQSNGVAVATAGNTIASGSSDVFSVVVSAPSNMTGGTKFNNTASVSSTTSDPVASNNSVTTNGSIAATVTTTGSADLSVTNTAPATAVQGNLITYQITVTNTDLVNTATGVTLTDTLGAKVSYQSATTTYGTFVQANGVVTFSIGSLAPGAVDTITVTAVAVYTGSSVSNMANVKSSSTDPVKANNTATSSTSVTAAPYVVSAPIVTTLTTITNMEVATFTHANGTTPVTAMAAKVSWGDGTSSAGTITLSGSTYSVTGSHTYTTGGSHTISTTVSDAGSPAQIFLANKAGDEVPELPDNFADDAITFFTSLANAYIAPTEFPSPLPEGRRPTLADLQSSLNAVFAVADPTYARSQLLIYANTIRSNSPASAALQDVLDLLAGVLT